MGGGGVNGETGCEETGEGEGKVKEREWKKCGAEQEEEEEGGGGRRCEEMWGEEGI